MKSKYVKTLLLYLVVTVLGITVTYWCTINYPKIYPYFYSGISEIIYIIYNLVLILSIFWVWFSLIKDKEKIESWMLKANIIWIILLFSTNNIYGQFVNSWCPSYNPPQELYKLSFLSAYDTYLYIWLIILVMLFVRSIFRKKIVTYISWIIIPFLIIIHPISCTTNKMTGLSLIWSTDSRNIRCWVENTLPYIHTKNPNERISWIWFDATQYKSKFALSPLVHSIQYIYILMILFVFYTTYRRKKYWKS